MKILLKIICWIIGLPIVICILWVGFWTYVIEYAPYHGMKFTKERWNADSGGTRAFGMIISGTSDRCRMYTDLRTNHLKKGMKLEEVQSLIGLPGIEIYCLEKKIKCIYYGLGTCYANSLTISHGSMDICFNEKQEIIAIGKAENSENSLHERICNYKHADRSEDCKYKKNWCSNGCDVSHTQCAEMYRGKNNPEGFQECLKDKPPCDSNEPPFSCYTYKGQSMGAKCPHSIEQW